jgi:hypothetical protein
MSSSPIFSSLTISRPFFPAPSPNSRKISVETLLTKSFPNVVPASRLEVRPKPELISSGIGQVDAIIGGFPRGCITEVCGPNSSGRTSLLLAALLATTRRAEVCALVDVSDAFDPASASAAGVDFQKFLWVRCGENQTNSSLRKYRSQEKNLDRVEQALRVTDLLLQSGGFGLVAIDLADMPFNIARRIPLASWFRFQRAVEHTPTVLLLITPAPCAQSCAALLLRMQAKSLEKKPPAFSSQFSACDIPAHAELLEGFETRAEVLRSRIARKPSRSVTATFTTKAVRAG